MVFIIIHLQVGRSYGAYYSYSNIQSTDGSEPSPKMVLKKAKLKLWKLNYCISYSLSRDSGMKTKKKSFNTASDITMQNVYHW